MFTLNDSLVRSPPPPLKDSSAKKRRQLLPKEQLDQQLQANGSWSSQSALLAASRIRVYANANKEVLSDEHYRSLLALAMLADMRPEITPIAEQAANMALDMEEQAKAGLDAEAAFFCSLDAMAVVPRCPAMATVGPSDCLRILAALAPVIPDVSGCWALIHQRRLGASAELLSVLAARAPVELRAEILQQLGDPSQAEQFREWDTVLKLDSSLESLQALLVRHPPPDPLALTVFDYLAREKKYSTLFSLAMSPPLHDAMDQWIPSAPPDCPTWLHRPQLVHQFALAEKALVPKRHTLLSLAKLSSLNVEDEVLANELQYTTLQTAISSKLPAQDAQQPLVYREPPELLAHCVHHELYVEAMDVVSLKRRHVDPAVLWRSVFMKDEWLLDAEPELLTEQRLRETLIVRLLSVAPTGSVDAQVLARSYPGEQAPSDLFANLLMLADPASIKK